MECSRRSFVKGAAVGTAAAAGMAATGAALADETANSTAAAGKWSWESKPDPIADEQIAETVECDVCVVGAGVSGNPAALYAATHGLNTVVLQKSDKARVNGQSYGAWNSSLADEYGVGGCDITAEMQKFAESVGSGKANLKLVRTVLEQTGPAIEWLTGLVTEPAPTLRGIEGTHVMYQWLIDGDQATRYAGFMDFFDNITAAAQGAGADYRFNTPAVQLVQDESGAVTGVIGQHEDGSYVKVCPSMGVILCTGDISDDEELVQAFAPTMVGVPSGHALECNTGDGLKMGMWVGAAFDDATSGLQMHISPTKLPRGMAPFAGVPWLHVNLKGKRFTNENVGFQALSTAISNQPEACAWQIIDSHLLEHANDYTNGGRPGNADSLAAGIESGTVLTADTLEELADAMELDADAKANFLATVERYNELVDGGEDLDYSVDTAVFGWNGIEDAPFYAMEYQPARLASGPGLVCDKELRVLDIEGEPIPGLYAAGYTQGSFFGYDYPVNGFGAFSNSHSVTGGILAVMSAAGTLGEPIA